MVPRRISTVCFCFSLRVGTVLIGLLYTGLALTIYVNELSTLIRFVMRYYEKHPIPTVIDTITILGETYPLCMFMIFGLYLAYGSIQVKSHFCCAFLVGQCLFIVLLQGIVMYTIYLTFTHPGPHTNYFRLISMDIIITAFLVYVALVIYSYYDIMPKRKFLSPT